MSNVRDWCRRGMSWNEKPKDLYWNWPVLYKQQIIVALISKQPTIPMFSFFLLIVFDQSQMFAIQKAKSIGNLEETCSLEIPCWQSSAVAKPTEHNDEDQSWDKILQFSKNAEFLDSKEKNKGTKIKLQELWGNLRKHEGHKRKNQEHKMKLGVHKPEIFNFWKKCHQKSIGFLIKNCIKKCNQTIAQRG